MPRVLPVIIESMPITDHKCPQVIGSFLIESMPMAIHKGPQQLKGLAVRLLSPLEFAQWGLIVNSKKTTTTHLSFLCPPCFGVIWICKSMRRRRRGGAVYGAIARIGIIWHQPIGPQARSTIGVGIGGPLTVAKGHEQFHCFQRRADIIHYGKCHQRSKMRHGVSYLHHSHCLFTDTRILRRFDGLGVFVQVQEELLLTFIVVFFAEFASVLIDVGELDPQFFEAEEADIAQVVQAVAVDPFEAEFTTHEELDCSLNGG